MKYFLGVDGGATKTLAVVCDALGHELARACTGGGNHQTDRPGAERNIANAVDGALGAAGLSKQQTAAAVFGLAGADREVDFRILRPMLAELSLPRWDLVCDTVIALKAGTRKDYGLVSICGTGTNTVAIDRSGRMLQIGGFGYVYGDFGGGGELAAEVFRSVIRAWEGRGPETLLTGPTLELLGYRDVEQMYGDMLDNGKYPPSGLARLLFAVADQDEVARGILMRQGIELGRTACAAIKKLGMQGDTFDGVLAGSVLTRGDRNGQYVRTYMEREVMAAAPGCSLRALDSEPVLGALLMAMRMDGAVVAPDVLEQLRSTLAI